MKIYFSGSIRGGRHDLTLYRQLVDLLRRHGAVLTEHVAAAALGDSGEAQLDDRWIFHRDKHRLPEADAVVAEVTVPSTGVGMELGYADEWGKPTLCLHRIETGHLSAMVGGCPSFIVVRYATLAEAGLILNRFFSTLSL